MKFDFPVFEPAWLKALWTLGLILIRNLYYFTSLSSGVGFLKVYLCATHSKG